MYEISFYNITETSVVISVLDSGVPATNETVILEYPDSSQVTYTLDLQGEVEVLGLSPNTTYTVYSQDLAVSETFTTLANANIALYGSVNDETTLVNELEGSVSGRAKQISKLYGPVSGKTALTHYSMGRLPRMGSVTYYVHPLLLDGTVDGTSITALDSSDFTIECQNSGVDISSVKRATATYSGQYVLTLYDANDNVLYTESKPDATQLFEAWGITYTSGSGAITNIHTVPDSTTNTVGFTTQAELESLCNPSHTAPFSITLENETFDITYVKEVIIPEWCQSIPDDFLAAGSRLDTVDIPYTVTQIGDNFLYGCTVFGQALDLFYVTSIGDGFLYGCNNFNSTLILDNLQTLGDGFLGQCSSYNKPTDVSSLSAIPNYFMQYVTAFNSTLDISGATSIGSFFLAHSTSFNQAVDLGNILTIGSDFMSYCSSFNQPLIIPATMTSIGGGFLFNCDDMVSVITCNAHASIADSSNYTFGTTNSSADSYVIGTSLGGTYSTEWIEKFPTRDTSPYRNVGYAHVPVLVPTSVQETSSSTSTVTYGVTSWDMRGSYLTGTVVLYHGTNATPTTQIDSYNQIGQTLYDDTGLVGNTKYYYRVVATNSGGEVTEETVNILTRPAAPSVSASDVGYVVYDTFEHAYTLTISANGGEETQTLDYRIKTTDETDYGQWIAIGTYGSASSGTVTLNLTLETDTAYNIEFRASNSTGGSSVVYNQASVPTHQGPTNVQFTLDDTNSDIQTWLSSFSGYNDENWFISAKSTPRVTIPVATAGSTTDGATLSQYTATIVSPDNGYSTDLAYDPDNDMTFTFAEASILSNSASGAVTMNLVAEDSLEATNLFVERGVYLAWASPVLSSATANRTSHVGQIHIEFSGQLSGLADGRINNGNDLNQIEVEYRVLTYVGEVITDWTAVDNADISVSPSGATSLNRVFSGSLTETNVDWANSVVVEVRAKDHFETTTSISIPLRVWDAGKIIDPVDYEIELWDWKTNTFVADISYLVVGDLEIEWVLNDVEEVSFDMDLLEFEKKCDEMGIDPTELLKPYAHDIRIRRNSEYILGCQLVEANIQLTNNPPAKISVRGTGFLNLFKDQYILDEAWSGYTYAQIARKLVDAAQKPDCLIKNPTCDIDISYWLAPNGTASYSTNSVEGDGCLAMNRSGTGWMTAATQMTIKSNTTYKLDCWVKGQSGRGIQIVERQYVNQPSNQKFVATFIANGSWQHVQVEGISQFDNGYLLIEQERSNSSTMLYADNVYVYARDDDATLCNMFVPLGVDTASPNQEATRQVKYELQNVKDALMDLTQMESDNFDFAFAPDRTFNIYERKGSDKLSLEILYPGNVENASIERSAANLANKIINIGSGIGDERLQVSVDSASSRQELGTRESVQSNSNVSLEGTLTTQAISDLYDRKDPTDLPTFTISDGSVNPSNIEVGDTIYPQIQSDDYLSSITGSYRVEKITLTVSEDGVERMKLAVSEEVDRPEKKMVRYIRNSIAGSTANGSSHWVEIQALMLQGNDYVNVAYGKPVYANFSPNQGTLDWVTNGNTGNSQNMRWDGGYQTAAVTIDLGEEYPIDYIKVWHYWNGSDNRRYLSNTLSVGTTVDSLTSTEPLEEVVWRYGPNYTGINQYQPYAPYVEVSTGQKSKWLQADNILSPTHRVPVRYIRESHLNNSATLTNMWAEIEALVKDSNGEYIDVALNNSTVYVSSPLDEGQVSNIVDGNLNTYVGIRNTEITRNAVTIDLGQEYYLDYIKLWHWLDGNYGNRTYYGSHLSVGTELPDGNEGIEDLETVLWEDDDNVGVAELSQGRPSDWVQGV